MKSRTLSFSVATENMKKQVWLPALIILGFFLAIPVVSIIRLEWFQASKGVLEDVADVYIQCVARNPLLPIMAGGSALLAGVSGFSWLHSRRKTDFYHSLPIRREKLFVMQVILDIAYFAVPYLLNLLLAYMVGAAYGVLQARAVVLSLQSYLFHLVFYLIFYFAAVLAMLLTGRMLAGVLGIVILMAYGPGLDAILRGTADIFFSTYANRGLVFSKILQESSPVITFVNMYGAHWYPSLSGSSLALCLLAAAVLALTCFCLYKKRPSESAGRVMAFYKIGKAIQYLLEVLAVLCSGILFYAMAVRLSAVWLVFGILLGGVLSHGILEVVQEGDIRQVMAHKRVLTASIATVLVILGIYHWDVFRYDDFFPGQGDLQAVRILMDDSYGGTEEDYTDEQMAAMQRLASDQEVYAAMEQIVKCRLQKKEMPRGAEYTDADGNQVDNRRYVRVEYTLGSGRIVQRAYVVDYERCRQQMLSLYDSEDYKKTAFPLMTLTEDELKDFIADVYIGSIKNDSFDLPGNSETRREFLKTYRAELMQMTSKTLEEEHPIGRITLGIDWRYVAEPGANLTSSRANILSNKDYSIYPSFTRTLRMLKEQGIELPESFVPEEIEYIEIYGLRNEEGASEDQDPETIREQEQIKKLLPHMFSDISDDELDFSDGVLAVVRLKNKGHSDDVACTLEKDAVPDFVTE